MIMGVIFIKKSAHPGCDFGGERSKELERLFETFFIDPKNLEGLKED